MTDLNELNDHIERRISWNLSVSQKIDAVSPQFENND